MKKFLLKISIYGFVSFVAFNTLSWGCLWFLRNSSFYKPEFLTHEIKETNFDYIIIGSSIGLTTLNTVQIDASLKINGLNLSIDDTSLNSNYLMLEHFYHQNKKTKYCVLAVSYWDMANENPPLNNNDYRFLPYISEDYVVDYYNKYETDCFKPLTLSRYFPFIGVAYYNTEIFYTSIVAAISPEKRNRFDSRGNYSYPEIGNIKSKSKEIIHTQWKNPSLNEISQLCKNNNTQLIIYQAPALAASIKNNNNTFSIINHSDLIVKGDCFFDDIHLSGKGRKVATEYFIRDFEQLLIKK